MVVGFVTGGSESSPYEFTVRIASGVNSIPDRMLKVGDIVKVEFEYGNVGRVRIYGVVTEITSSWDIEMRGFEESLAVEKGLKPKVWSFLASVTTTRIVSEAEPSNPPDVPPIPGSPVELVDGEETSVALSFDTFEDRKLPIGILENGEPAYLDLGYILGDNGAHINISGQSGVASKTSYMTFLMRSLVDTIGKSEKPIFIIFNVKGDDLMFIDHHNREWIGAPEWKKREWEKMYRKLGIRPEPFENVKFYAVSTSDVMRGSPDSPRKDAEVFSWGTDDFFDLGLFEMIFDPQELERNNNLMLAVANITELMEGEHGGKYRRLVSNPFELMRELDDGGEVFNALSSSEVPKSTIKLLRRRIKLVINMGLPKIWKREPSRIEWNVPGRITVIDIHKLRTRMQALVVGAVIREIMREREKGYSKSTPVFVMIDELNKYAPRREKSEIASIFRDLAERGRSFRVILVGAEQTASEVDYRVVTQAATVVVGRQKWVELSKDEYGHLLPEQKRKAATLMQGSVIVDQPFMRVPLVVRFPMPAWATSYSKIHVPQDEELF